MKRMKINVHGRVQRVGFRSFAKKLAETLSLDGWVKNSPDGSLEILVEGPERLVDDFVEYCRKGPPLAKISKVDVTEEKLTDKLRGFEIIL